MRAKPQRTQNWQEMRIAWRFSLRFSTPARYARLRGKAQREPLSCPCGTEGRSERERTPRNHIQRTYKGCEPRATLGVRWVAASTLKGWSQLSPARRTLMANNQTNQDHSRLRQLAWLPVPLLALAIVCLWIANLRTVYESRALMVLLNLLFTWLASLLICVLTARGFLGSGQPALLMFGCGSMLWGVTSLAAAMVVDRVNPTITVHNLGVFGAALCHFVGLLWRGRLSRPGQRLVIGYAGALMTAALIIWAALAGLLPVFFLQGQGGTMVREVVLLTAVLMFAW